MTSVTEANRNELFQIGATKIEGLFSEAEMDEIELAIDDVIAKPSPMRDIFESKVNGEPLFFNDFNNWRRVPSLKKVCFSEKFHSTVTQILDSERAFFFHDHIIVKNRGASKATPWHIDKTYYMLDCQKTVTLWIPPFDMQASESLQFASGSHAMRKLLMPKSFESNENLEDGSEFIDYDYSNVEKDYEIVSWDHKRGDAIAFTFYTLHSAPAHTFAYDRKVLSLRFFGDGATFDARVKNPAPPFVQMGYKGTHGQPLSEKWFPAV